MKNLPPLLIVLAITTVTGCFSQRTTVSADAAGSSSPKDANTDAYGRDPSHPKFGWMSIDEPFGDESSLDYKLTPAEVKPGQPARLEVHTGGSYGPITGTIIMVRTTSGSSRNEDGYVATPMDGKEWTVVAPEGVYVRVEQDDGSTRVVRYEPGDQGYRSHAIDDPGWTRFITDVTPAANEPIIELRWHTPEWDNDRDWKALADLAIQIYPPIQ